MGDSTASAADPFNMAGYDAIIGRGLTEEGDDTMSNVLYYEDAENEDLKTRPMCSVGGTLNRPDFQGPSPDCCRVYEAADFMGLHYDFCIYNKDTYEKYWQLDTYGWHNEINSWRCGDNVTIKICAHKDDTSKYKGNDCDDGQPNVQTGFDQNPDVGIKEGNGRNEHDSIWIRRPKPGCNPCPRGMVYDLPDCKGSTFMVEPNYTGADAA